MSFLVSRVFLSVFVLCISTIRFIKTCDMVKRHEVNETTMEKMHVGAILAVAATLIAVSVLAASLLTAYQTVPNGGNVKAVGVGVYWDNPCTSNVTSIDWGIVGPGSSANKTVYIKNGGNTREALNMTTANWNAGVYGNITLSWNDEGYLLDPGSVVQAVLTLSVSSSISGVTSFSFNMIITGTEHA
jgi:hypothetical protein